MTEEEAKTKWCFQRAHRITNGDGKLVPSHQHACIGSACTAWRTASANRATIRSKTKPNAETFEVDEASGYAPEYWHIEPLPATGYCGLAGQP